MEEPYNQTSAYITLTYSATKSHITDFGNAYTSWTHFEDAHLNQSAYCDHHIGLITACVMFSFAFLGLCLTVYGLYSAVRTDRFVAVYIINLFICDLIQTFAMLTQMTGLFLYFKRGQCNEMIYNIITMIYNIGLVMNICFMVCISADRYVMIAHPVWHRNINRTSASIFVSVTIWIIFAVLTIIIFIFFLEHLSLCALLVFILPYPLVIIFFVGTWRSLSRNTTISPQGKRRIMGTLALVLFIYTVLFLPCIIKWIFFITPPINYGTTLLYYQHAADTVLTLNPLFDFLLYLVIRRDAKEILSALFFCFHKKHVENSVTDTMTEDQV